MTILIIIIYILTVIDAACTALGVSDGIITEDNALFQAVMTAHPVLTAIAVSVIMGVIFYGIWRLRKRIKWLPYAMVVVLMVKVVIIGMHVSWITQATALNLW